MSKKTKKFVPGQQSMCRFGKYCIDEVLPYIEFMTKVERKKYGEHEVNMTSDRLLLFALKGIQCKKCGIKASHFWLEKHKNGNTDRPHFNLYGVDSTGEEVLFTKDHIVPKSKGGKNSLDNYQTMCAICNHDKADIC